MLLGENYYVSNASKESKVEIMRSDASCSVRDALRKDGGATSRTRGKLGTGVVKDKYKNISEGMLPVLNYQPTELT